MPSSGIRASSAGMVYHVTQFLFPSEESSSTPPCLVVKGASAPDSRPLRGFESKSRGGFAARLP